MDTDVRADWHRSTVATTREVFAWQQQPQTCTCGQALQPFNAEGAGGYVNGYKVYAATRPQVRAWFAGQPIKHDVIERQWWPGIGGEPNELLERRHRGRCRAAQEG